MEKTDSTEGLFACSKCHGRFAFEELSRSEHLCKVSWIFVDFVDVYVQRFVNCIGILQ